MTDSDATTARLTARSWSVVDAMMDNVGHSARFDEDTQLEDAALAVRQAGWDQIPWIDGEWPPMDQALEIRMSPGLWRLVVERLRYSLARPVDDECEALERAALVEVERQVDSTDQARQIQLATQRLEILDAVALAQNRYAEVSEAIAASADKYEARAAVGRLLGVREDVAGAVTELIWFRLTAADRRQVREDRDEIVAELRAAGVEPTWASGP